MEINRTSELENGDILPLMIRNKLCLRLTFEEQAAVCSVKDQERCVDALSVCTYVCVLPLLA